MATRKPSKKAAPKKAAKKSAPAKPSSKGGTRKPPKKKPVFILEEETPEAELTQEERDLLEEENKRSTWDFNNEAICESFMRLMKKNKRFPTYAGIAKDVGLNERTIRRHFEKGDILGSQIKKIKMLQDQSIITVAMKAIAGEDVQWNKLLHEIASGTVGGRISATARSSTPEQPAGGSGGAIETEVTLHIS